MYLSTSKHTSTKYPISAIKRPRDLRQNPLVRLKPVQSKLPLFYYHDKKTDQKFMMNFMYITPHKKSWYSECNKYTNH